MKFLSRVLIAGCLGLMLAIGALWLYAGSYGFHVLLRHGGTFWIDVKTDDPRLSPSMRLALHDPPPASAGSFDWREVGLGFEVAELPVIAGGNEVDRIMLARIDPARFRFEVRNAATGDKGLDQWMTQLAAALVINGSFFSRYGTPNTPLLSAGTLLGPEDYDAKAGAFVASAAFVGIRDLAHEDWQAAFRGADDAMVSFPLLMAEDATRKNVSSRWLANRSFVGQDKNGWIVLGTTTDAFFSLERFGEFLRQAPLGLTLALNLDGGPVACQGIAINGFARRTYGRWEVQVQGEDAKLLTWLYGTVAMPVVLAVFPK
jgi:Phosphodiester glycosidase